LRAQRRVGVVALLVRDGGFQRVVIAEVGIGAEVKVDLVRFRAGCALVIGRAKGIARRIVDEVAVGLAADHHLRRNTRGDEAGIAIGDGDVCKGDVGVDLRHGRHGSSWGFKIKKAKVKNQDSELVDFGQGSGMKHFFSLHPCISIALMTSPSELASSWAMAKALMLWKFSEKEAVTLPGEPDPVSPSSVTRTIWLAMAWALTAAAISAAVDTGSPEPSVSTSTRTRLDVTVILRGVLEPETAIWM